MFCILMLLKRFASTGTLPPTIRQILSSGKDTASNVHVHGWIKSVRRQKNVTFAVVNDGSCASGLQTVLNNSLNANFQGYVTFHRDLGSDLTRTAPV